MKTPRNIPRVHCRHCDGAGRTPLQADLWRTLKAMRPMVRAISWDLREKGVTLNAINNRLVDLEGLGLIKRVGKTGKWIEWEAVK